MTLTTWNFDLSHSTIDFWVRHLMVSKVHGRFGQWSGTLELDEDDLTRSRVEVEIDTASIDTQEPKRDAHLRSADFLEVDQHPKMTFKSSRIDRVADDRYAVHGDLTIRGTTRPVTLDVEYSGRVKDPWGGERLGLSAKATILRKDFGLTWNLLLETGGVVVGDKIEIGLEVEAIRAATASAAA
jgi:polyisoprenoid-binding protein YceI